MKYDYELTRYLLRIDDKPYWRVLKTPTNTKLINFIFYQANAILKENYYEVSVGIMDCYVPKDLNLKNQIIKRLIEKGNKFKYKSSWNNMLGNLTMEKDKEYVKKINIKFQHLEDYPINSLRKLKGNRYHFVVLLNANVSPKNLGALVYLKEKIIEPNFYAGGFGVIY